MPVAVSRRSARSSARRVDSRVAVAVDAGRRRRRCVRLDDRTYIEVRGLGRPELPVAYGRAVELALEQVPGVQAAQLNAALGTVTVVCPGSGVATADLVAAVAAVEHAFGLERELFPRRAPHHPADSEPLRMHAVALAGDLLGATVAGFGQLAGTRLLPLESGALLTVFDHVPRVRRALEDRLGPAASDLTLAMTSAAVAAAAYGPLGPVVDGANRVASIAECRARRAAWRRRADELNRSGYGRVPASPAPARATPLPDGPVERCAARASVISLVAAGALLPGSRGAQRAATALLVGAGSAGRRGRESFAAILGRCLAQRDILVLDPDVLRRLDRLDTVLLDATCLRTGRAEIGEVIPADRRDDVGALHSRIHQLLDPVLPEQIVSKQGWTLGPLRALSVSPPDRLSAWDRMQRRNGAVVLGLCLHGRVIALSALQQELDPYAEAVTAAARKLGTLVVAGRGSGVARRLGVQRVVAGGSRLVASIRDLQAEGAGVLLVSPMNSGALRAADCGVGLLTEDQRPPWNADLLCGPGLESLWLVLEGAALARPVSRRSARLELLGAVAGGLVALSGPARSAVPRSLLPVHLAALAAIGSGAWSGSYVARRDPPLPVDRTPWHALAVEDVLRQLGSARGGLSVEQAQQRLASSRDQRGESRPPGILHATWEELDNPLTPPLATGAGASAAVGAALDAALIASTMMGNAFMSGVQRVATRRALSRLVHTGAVAVRLRRSGADVVTTAGDVVPGDVIALCAGDVVPADCRIMTAAGLEVDESTVTGESLPVSKGPAPSSARSIADRTSMLWAGTTVAAGTAVAVAVATGRTTESSRSAVIDESQHVRGGVEERLRRMTDVSVPVAAGAAGLLLGIGALRGQLSSSVAAAVGLTVAAVPEGLPLVANVASLAAARRLAGHGALVRNAGTMEALGRVDVLCFDKTGTLTEGRIRLRRVLADPVEEPVQALSHRCRAVLAAALRATPSSDGDGDLPHATDRAVVLGGKDAGVRAADGATGWQVVDELPFEPARGFHAVLGKAGGSHLLAVKGAPEVVLPRCSTYSLRDGERPLLQADRSRTAQEVDRLARRGYRVLAVAERRASSRPELDESRVGKLTFLGLLALADPVRSVAARAISDLRSAGVRVVMVTGDHPSTAEAIAAELGMLDGGLVVSGADIDSLDEEALVRTVTQASVFARVTPSHKVAIVRALRRSGRVVAMTGDGANDAPAIRLADVGVAVGARSTTAARDAADVVVTDDRIETVIDAIVEGRAMWAAVRDAIAVLLGGNLGEIGFTVLSAAFSPRPVLNARQLLLVNLLTDLLPSMAIAVRPPRRMTPERLLREGPDASLGEGLVRDVAGRAASTLVATTGGWLASRSSGGPTHASTVALASLVGAQLSQSVAAARGDPLVIAATVLSGLALVGIVQNPLTSWFFGCRPLGPVGWMTAGTASTAAAAMAPAVVRILPDLPAR